MSYRHYQLDVTCTFTTNLLFCYFHTTTVADDAFVTDTLVLTAVAFIVLHLSEVTFAEQTIKFRLVGTVVYSLRLQHLTERTFQDFFRRSQSDGNLREITLYL